MVNMETYKEITKVLSKLNREKLVQVQYDNILKYLHYHFSVMAAFFLGFNLKNRKMVARLAYVAKTHYRKKTSMIRY